MTLRGGGGLGCDANILFKAHLDFVDVWLVKLVQGGYIPSAFHPTTHILIAKSIYSCYRRGRLLLPIFEISNS